MTLIASEPSQGRSKLLAVLLALTLFLSGCQSISRAGNASYEWAGATFPENPVSIGPYFLGLGLGVLAAAPLLLFSWPLTALFFPENGDEEDRIWSTIAPCAFLGSTTGTLLAAPFYPFGIPFMPEDSEEDLWSDEGWKEDEGDFADGPPGGDEHPVPVPWRSFEDIPREDGRPVPPYSERVLLEPWEPYDRALPVK